jgi:hypothetical protein
MVGSATASLDWRRGCLLSVALVFGLGGALATIVRADQVKLEQGCGQSAQGNQETTAVGPLAARVTVDSCSPGYRSEVLTDGKRFENGQEDPSERGPNRLGNSGNTWVSGESRTEHWIRMDWPEPVTLDELVIWWSLADWYPRAFRVEHLQGEEWVPVGPDQAWLAATSRQSVIPLPSIQARSIRVLQPAFGSGSRALFAAQEVTAWNRGGKPRPLSGARRLSSRTYARLAPGPLARNIARLDEGCPGASSAVVWRTDGRTSCRPALADGDLERPAADLGPETAVGIEWPIAHVIDDAVVVFAQSPPEPATLSVEVHDGLRWVPITVGLKCRTITQQRRMEWSFEPMATRAARIRGLAGAAVAKIAEVEMCRYLPASATVWPDRLIKPEGLQQELLAAPEEPSFESLSLWGLSMRSARALLGLKDTAREVGASWDGALEGRGRLEFCVGPERYHLAEFADTVRRTLIDGWRPGVVIQGRADDFEIKETAFVAPVGRGGAGVLVVRLDIRNVSNRPTKTWIEAAALGEQEGAAEFKDGLMIRGSQVALIASDKARVGESANAMCVDLELEPGQERSALFVEPQDPVPIEAGIESYRSISFDGALASFRQYWDDALATATSFEVPEPRVNRMAKAVLAQCFVNGDGDVMPYGSAPSVYEGSLFGIEESYPILALAMFGFGSDAQRYLDGTYLTRQFLKKAEEYKDSEDRHQQYRNGLQPHYAVSAYRFTRDTAWIRKHLPLLKDCADWTMAQRRKTMVLIDGQRPLHWGLLPKWAYGGDIGEVTCYALFGNLCCWKGLVDTAWLLDELGEHEAAKRYADDAREYRAAIDRAIDGSYLEDRRPPFLPLRLYADQPDEQLDYYQLFAGCLLDVEAFPAGSRQLHWITDYLEADNRVFCLLPRFRHLGPGALDAIYGKGYFLAKLHEGAVREFLLAFYAYLSFNLEHDVFTSRESNVLYASDLHACSAYPAAEITDPLPCASAVALQLLRHMLVTEERAGAGGYSGNLLLLAGAPRTWLADGQRISIRNAPTFFGELDVEVRSQVAQGRIEARVVPPTRYPGGTIRLRLPHPERRSLQSVTVNGKPYADFDPQKEWIVLSADLKDSLEIIARY